MAPFSSQPEMPIKVSQPSIKSLYIEMYFKEVLLSSGTAFICHNQAGTPFLITNRHNVTGRRQDNGQPISNITAAVPDRIRITHNADSFATFIEKIERLYDNNDAPLWFEHPSLKEKADLVALKLTDLTGISVHDYQPNSLSHLLIQPSDPVSIIGFPFGIRNGKSFAVWSTGFVASEPEINHDNLPIFLVDCRTRQGQSGSPVIQHQSIGTLNRLGNSEYETAFGFSNLLGVYSGRVNADSDIGVVWKSSAIKELLDSTAA